MKNDWDLERYGEDIFDYLKTDEERALEQAELSMEEDPTLCYGLGEEAYDSPHEKTEEQIAYDNQRKVSRGRLYSTYQVFTKEKAAKLKI